MCNGADKGPATSSRREPVPVGEFLSGLFRVFRLEGFLIQGAWGRGNEVEEVWIIVGDRVFGNREGSLRLCARYD